MENIQPQDVPELEQPDFLKELEPPALSRVEPPKPRRKANIIPMEDMRPSDNEDDRVCPECENHDRNCTRCYGRNYLPSK